MFNYKLIFLILTINLNNSKIVYIKGKVMININKIYYFYIDGFKNMKIGKTLWKIIFIKLLVILIILNYFIHDKSINTEYKSAQSKSDFVYHNLILKGN